MIQLKSYGSLTQNSTTKQTETYSRFPHDSANQQTKKPSSSQKKKESSTDSSAPHGNKSAP
jgi:hypothetical protein